MTHAAHTVSVHSVHSVTIHVHSVIHVLYMYSVTIHACTYIVPQYHYCSVDHVTLYIYTEYTYTYVISLYSWSVHVVPLYSIHNITIHVLNITIQCTCICSATIQCIYTMSLYIYILSLYSTHVCTCSVTIQCTQCHHTVYTVSRYIVHSALLYKSSL